MRLLVWIILVVLVALRVNASSPADPKAAKTLESGSELFAQNEIQDERYLRGTGEPITPSIVANLNELMKKPDYSTIFSNILKRKHIPSLKYLPYGKKFESWLLFRALRKAYKDVTFKDVKDPKTDDFFEHFVNKDYKPNDVREKLGSGKTVDDLVQKYAIWIGQNSNISSDNKARLITGKTAPTLPHSL